MRASRLAVIAAILAAACSLVTRLAPPTDVLCTPEIVADVGDAGLTSVVVDSVTNAAYFSGTTSNAVYSVALDAGAGSKANVVMTLDAPRRLAIANGNVGKNVFDTYVFATAQGSTGDGGLFVLAPDASQSSIVSGANVHADGLFVRGAYAPSIYWLASDPSGNGSQVRSSAVDGSTSVLADVDASLHDIVATDALTIWTTTKTGATVIGFGDAGAKSTPCAGVIAYQPAGPVPARLYVTSETGCNGTHVIQWLPADDPSALATQFATARVNGTTSMVYDGAKYLYWANFADGTIARRIVDESKDEEAVATSPAPPHQIAYLAGVLYWTTDTALVRCALR
jgi:hypothetical protein